MSRNNSIGRDDDRQRHNNWTGWFGGPSTANNNMKNGNARSPVASSSSSGWLCSSIPTGGSNEPTAIPTNSAVLSSGRVTPPPQSDSGGNNNGGCFSWITTTNTSSDNQYDDQYLQHDDNGGTSGKVKAETPSIIPADDLVSQIAKELSSLSVEGRNELHEEIHGIATIPPEDPDDIAKKLQQLDSELSKHATPFQSSPYEKAMRLNPSYVGGRPFRLMFLRAYGYDPELAAMHTLRHFEWKYKLFVDDRRRKNGAAADDIGVLGRPVTLNDLDQLDMEFLQKGVMLFAPGFDMAGRRVFVVSANLVNAPGETFHNLVS